MPVTELGMVTEVKLLQLEKAMIDISVTEIAGKDAAKKSRVS